MTQPTDSLIAVFESQLLQRGIEFEVLDDGRYELTTAGGRMTVALDNLSRKYARNEDADAVGRFIDSVLSGSTPLPDWHVARDGLFPMIENGDTKLRDDTIRKSLSDETFLIPAHFNAEAGIIRFLRHSDVDRWGTTEDELWRAAESTLDKIMHSTEVTYLDANGFQLGMIKAHEPHKASLIRAPSLRRKVEDELGWPIYAVAPSRGFVFLISKSDGEQLGLVGASVIKEFTSAEYPISTEVWEVGDSGIDAIGSFPVE